MWAVSAYFEYWGKNFDVSQEQISVLCVVLTDYLCYTQTLCVFFSQYVYTHPRTLGAEPFACTLAASSWAGGIQRYLEFTDEEEVLTSYP